MFLKAKKIKHDFQSRRLSDGSAIVKSGLDVCTCGAARYLERRKAAADKIIKDAKQIAPRLSKIQADEINVTLKRQELEERERVIRKTEKMVGFSQPYKEICC